nr:MAG TPA: hypothetical protein [Caudoviricetes sp.]
MAVKIESFLFTVIVVNSFSFSFSLKSTFLVFISTDAESFISVLITCTY